MNDRRMIFGSMHACNLVEMYMNTTFDTIIIGGGIIGLSCGYYLSRKKKRVLVLDAKGFADGASGACDDMILFQSKKPGINLELSFKSLELYKGLKDQVGDDLGFENYGGMVLIETKKELEVMEDFVRQQRSYGLEVDLIDEKEMRKRQPYISSRFIASTYCPTDSQVYPFSVMHSFEQMGKEEGMCILRHRRVIGLQKDGNGDFTVTTSTGEKFVCEQVVNAAGAWAGSIAECLGECVPVVPKRGQIIITEKIPPVGKENLWSARYLVTKLNPEMMNDSSDEEQRSGLAFAFTRSHGNSYLIGSTREYVGFDKRTTFEGIRDIVRQAVSFVPVMKKVNFIRAMAGLRPSTPDGKMILGEHDRVRNFFTVAGHEGDGIALAPITGRIVSDLLCGGKNDRALQELSPNRFNIPGR